MSKSLNLGKILSLLMLSVFILSCQSETRERPYGYLRLGEVGDLLSDMTPMPDKWLILQNHADGLSAMSTLCSKDLETLIQKGDELECDECGSRFNLNGEVISGPAKAPLSHYPLKVDAKTVGGEKDTLYVIIGEPVPASWRLRLHFVDKTPDS